MLAFCQLLEDLCAARRAASAALLLRSFRRRAPAAPWAAAFNVALAHTQVSLAAVAAPAGQPCLPAHPPVQNVLASVFEAVLPLAPLPLR